MADFSVFGEILAETNLDDVGDRIEESLQDVAEQTSITDQALEDAEEAVDDLSGSLTGLGAVADGAEEELQDIEDEIEDIRNDSNTATASVAGLAGTLQTLEAKEVGVDVKTDEGNFAVVENLLDQLDDARGKRAPLTRSIFRAGEGDSLMDVSRSLAETKGVDISDSIKAIDKTISDRIDDSVSDVDFDFQENEKFLDSLISNLGIPSQRQGLFRNTFNQRGGGFESVRDVAQFIGSSGFTDDSIIEALESVNDAARSVKFAADEADITPEGRTTRLPPLDPDAIKEPIRRSFDDADIAGVINENIGKQAERADITPEGRTSRAPRLDPDVVRSILGLQRTFDDVDREGVIDEAVEKITPDQADITPEGRTSRLPRLDANVVERALGIPRVFEDVDQEGIIDENVEKSVDRSRFSPFGAAQEGFERSINVDVDESDLIRAESVDPRGMAMEIGDSLEDSGVADPRGLAQENFGDISRSTANLDSATSDMVERLNEQDRLWDDFDAATTDLSDAAHATDAATDNLSEATDGMEAVSDVDPRALAMGGDELDPVTESLNVDEGLEDSIDDTVSKNNALQGSMSRFSRSMEDASRNIGSFNRQTSESMRGAMSRMADEADMDLADLDPQLGDGFDGVNIEEFNNEGVRVGAPGTNIEDAVTPDPAGPGPGGTERSLLNRLGLGDLSEDGSMLPEGGLPLFGGRRTQARTFVSGLSKSLDDVSEAATKSTTTLGFAAGAAGVMAGSYEKAANAVDDLDDELEDLNRSLANVLPALKTVSANLGPFNIGLTNLAVTIPTLIATIGPLVSIMGGLVAAAVAAGGALAAIIGVGALGFLEDLENNFLGVTNKMEAAEAIAKGLKESFVEAIQPITDITIGGVGPAGLFITLLRDTVQLTRRFSEGLRNIFNETDAYEDFFLRMRASILGFNESMDGFTLGDAMEDLAESGAIEVMGDFAVALMEMTPHAAVFFGEILAEAGPAVGDVLDSFMGLSRVLTEVGSGGMALLLPALASLIDRATLFVRTLKNLDEELGGLGDVMIAISASALVMFLGIIKVISVADTLLELGNALSKTYDLFADVLIRNAENATILSGRMATLTGIMSKFALSIAGIIGGLILIVKGFELLAEATTGEDYETFAFLADIVGNVGSGFVSLIQDILGFVGIAIESQRIAKALIGIVLILAGSVMTAGGAILFASTALTAYTSAINAGIISTGAFSAAIQTLTGSIATLGSVLLPIAVLAIGTYGAFMVFNDVMSRTNAIVASTLVALAGIAGIGFGLWTSGAASVTAAMAGLLPVLTGVAVGLATFKLLTEKLNMDETVAAAAALTTGLVSLGITALTVSGNLSMLTISSSAAGRAQLNLAAAARMARTALMTTGYIAIAAVIALLAAEFLGLTDVMSTGAEIIVAAITAITVAFLGSGWGAIIVATGLLMMAFMRLADVVGPAAAAVIAAITAITIAFLGSGWGAIVVAIGLAIVALYQAVKAFGAFKVAALVAIGAVTAALIGSGVGAIVVAIGLALLGVIKYWDELKSAILDGTGPIANEFEKVKDLVTSLVKPRISTKWWNEIVDAYKVLEGLSQSALAWVVQLFTDPVNAIKTLLDTIVVTINSITDMIIDAINMIPGVNVGGTESGGFVSDLISGALAGGAAGGAAGSVVPGLGTVAGAGVGAVAGGLGNALAGGMNGVPSLGRGGFVEQAGYAYIHGDEFVIPQKELRRLASSVDKGVNTGTTGINDTPTTAGGQQTTSNSTVVNVNIDNAGGEIDDRRAREIGRLATQRMREQQTREDGR